MVTPNADASPPTASQGEPLPGQVRVSAGAVSTHSWLALSVGLGVVHALVDATTVTVVLRSTRSEDVTRLLAFWLVVGYDWIAFATQPVWGYLMDRWATPRATRAAGLLLCLVSVAACTVDPYAAMVLAGLGNALFHLGAGAAVLRLGLSRTLPSGLYVAPGALGLGFGMFYGRHVTLGPVWPLAVVLGLGALLAIALSDPPLSTSTPTEPVARARALRNLAKPLLEAPAPTWREQIGRWALLLLLVSVAVRSLVGMSASRGYPKDVLLAIGIPLAGFLGKATGGWFADRWGWLETSVIALLLSAPFIGVTHGQPVLLLVGLVLFQMTMPVTLVAVARLMPARLGTAFGLTCLALAVGSAPPMFPWGRPLCDRSSLLPWILVGVTAVYFGLRMAGIRRCSFLVPLKQRVDT